MKLRRREATEAQIPSRRLQRFRLQRFEGPIERAHSRLQEVKRPARPLDQARRLGAAPWEPSFGRSISRACSLHPKGNLEGSWK